jgi:hypothetical protein
MTEQRIPPMEQTTVDHIAALLTMVNAEQAGNILTAATYRLIANAIDRGWSSKLAGQYAFDSAERIIASMRQPRPLQ